MLSIAERDLLHQLCGQIVLAFDKCFVNGFVLDRLCGEVFRQAERLITRITGFRVAEIITLFCDKLKDLRDVRAVHIAVQIDVCARSSHVGDGCIRIRCDIPCREHGIRDVHGIVRVHITVFPDACRDGILCGNGCGCDAAARKQAACKHRCCLFQKFHCRTSFSGFMLYGSAPVQIAGTGAFVIL